MNNHNNNNNNNNDKINIIKFIDLKYSHKDDNKNKNNKTKTEIDIFLKRCENTYKNKILDSCLFNGHLGNIKYNDPNLYLYDEIEKKKLNEKLTQKTQKTQKTKKNNQHKKEFVFIESNIETIQDLLNIINTYEYDENKIYNIDLKSLHKIKESLIKLNNMVGMKDLKKSIVYQILYFIQNLHKNGDGDFMHSVIYGPPGTGKTEISKILGQLYSNIGVLTKGTFKKVTRSDLIAGYLGQTAIKTSEVIKESLGGVLFIDEAYSLGNSEKQDSFSKECIDTLCESLSEHKNNLMVIIAGYENELNECFFNYNKGLDSRFTWRFKTDDYSYEDLHKIFVKKVNDIKWVVDENSGIKPEWFKKNNTYFKYYGRDIETLLSKIKIAHGKRIFGKCVKMQKIITLDDLNNGFELYLNNNEVKNRKEREELKKSLSLMYV